MKNLALISLFFAYGPLFSDVIMEAQEPRDVQTKRDERNQAIDSFHDVSNVSPKRPVIPSSNQELKWTCNTHDEIARRAIVDELRLAYTKTLVNLFDFQVQYRSMSDKLATPRDHDRHLRLGLNQAGRELDYWMKKQYEFNRSFQKMAGSNNDSGESLSHLVTMVPGFASSYIPQNENSLTNFLTNGKALMDSERLSFKISGRMLLASGVVSMLLTSSGQMSSRSSLNSATSGPTLSAQKRLQEDLFAPLEKLTGNLGDLLEWTQAQRDHLNRIVRMEIMKGVTTMVKTTQMTDFTSSNDVFIESFPEIDLLKIMEREKLVTPGQLEGLRHLELLQTKYAEIGSYQTPRQVKRILGKGNQDDFETIQKTIGDLIQFHSALTRMGDPSNETALNTIRSTLGQAIEVIRALCQLKELEGPTK